MSSIDAAAFSLQGKKGLVLGLANERSIAWACARLAREQGAEVVASCLNDKARVHVQPLTDAADITLVNCNVEQPGELPTLVEQAVQRLGRLDFVIHSIAWAPLAELHGAVTATSGEGFARAMRVSCHSFAELARLVAPHMGDGGSLVTMSYLGANVAVPNYGLMGPVKAALESLVRYMAQELGPQRLRVHAVSAGPILTRAASGLDRFDELMQRAEQKAPLGRLVTPDEVAGLSLFLCMDAAAGMSGQTLYVDGGYHAVD